LHEAHPAVAGLRVAPQIRQLDGHEPVNQHAELDHRRAHQATAAVTGAGNLAGVADIDSGPQHIGKTEPVGGSQFLDVTEFPGWRFVVMGESRIKTHPGPPSDRFRWDPGQ
jgi:hypothetical protein